MTSRARGVEAALAAIATLAALFPLTSLFTPAHALWPVALVVLVIAATGVALRSVWRRTSLIFMGQLFATAVLLVLLYGRPYLTRGLPGRTLLLAWNDLLVQGIETIQTYTAPAPTEPGVVLGLSLIVAALALVIDLVAVTRHNPAIAGLALLTAYLVSAANASSGLHPIYFLLAAGAWLVMVAHQGGDVLRRWGTIAGAARPESAVGMSTFSHRLAGAGRRLGILTLALAVLLPLILPSLPERYLFEGLSRSNAGTGGGTVSLSSSFDIANSLANQSDQPVLRYTTEVASPGPLRVGIFDLAQTRGQGLTWRQRVTRGGDNAFPATDPQVLNPDVPSTPHRITVTESQIAAPAVALPQPLRAFGTDDRDWSLNADGDVVAATALGSYAADFLTLSPTEEQLHAGAAAGDAANPDDLELDPGSAAYLRQLSPQIIPEGADQITAARAILQYLQQPEFVYNLELAPFEPGQSRNALIHFLETKQGYCIQYASAMIMLARLNGIPARMAVGFLPGTLDGTGAHTVVAADAHAWPELYLDGVGWLRFEPTPSSHAGSGPGWSVAPVDVPTSQSSTAGPVPSNTTAAANTPSRPIEDQQVDSAPVDTGSGLGLVSTMSATGWFLMVVLLAVLAGLGLPLLAVVRRRQSLSAAATDAARVEAQWQSLMHHVSDLGIAPPAGATPRQSAEHLRSTALLADDDAQVAHQIVDTVERARYTEVTPDEALPDLTAATRRLRGALDRSRPARWRLRALLLPAEGRAVLTSLWARIRGTARRH